MFRVKMTWGRWVIVLGVILVALVALVIAALLAREDDNEPEDLIVATDIVGGTPVAGPLTPGPSAPPESTNTPLAPVPDLLFEEAAALARADLSARLDVVQDVIEVLDPDTSLFWDEPVECPEITAEDLTVHYIYLQHERFIYPYQVYVLPAPDDDIVVEACSDVLVDEDVLYVPTPDARATIRELVLADLAARGIDTTQGNFEVVRTATWNDTALGCRVGPDDDAPAPVLIDGFLFVFVIDTTQYEYHTDATGEQIAYCAPPPGYETVEELVAVMLEDDILEADQVPDEVAAYNGLDAEGVLLELRHGNRIGLIGFETPEAARDAAFLIDDPNVSRIFVSGQVLIVQEENSPEVHSGLLNYGVEVRSPVRELEEEAEAAED